MTFNPHQNRTTDGVVIHAGLRVITNDMTLGTVAEDQGVNHSCCENLEHRGQMFVRDMDSWFTDHSTTCDVGGHCRHDHWFTVETEDGSKSYNGERLGTKIHNHDGTVTRAEEE